MSSLSRSYLPFLIHFISILNNPNIVTNVSKLAALFQYSLLNPAVLSTLYASLAKKGNLYSLIRTSHSTSSRSYLSYLIYFQTTLQKTIFKQQ